MPARFVERLDGLAGDESVVDLAAKLVKIPSHRLHPLLEQDVAAFLLNFFHDNGIPAELSQVSGDRSNVIAVLKGLGGGKTLMLNGHMDTVPPYDMEDPFGAQIKDGYLFGRGSVDTKGGLAAMAASLVALKKSRIPLLGDVVLTAVADEEGPGQGTWAVVNSSLTADGAIVAEPTNFRICRGCKGLVWLEMEVLGKTVHGGARERGVSAISKSAKLISRMEDAFSSLAVARRHEFLGEPTINFGVINGGTQPSTIAGQCKMLVDRRFTIGENIDSLWADFNAVFDALRLEDPDFRVEVRPIGAAAIGIPHLPFVTAHEDPLITSLSKAIGLVTGVAGIEEPFTAWSDAGMLAVQGGIPSVVFGPGDMVCAHTSVEYVATADLIAATRVYAQTAACFCGLRS